MHRTTLVTLLVAGLVGLLGGTGVAVLREDTRPDPLPPLTQPAAQRSTLLYADATAIHDGGETISYTRQEGTPARLVRTHDGYLLATATSPQEPSSRLVAIDRDGTTTKVADVLGSWDLDQDGRRVVGTDLDSGGVFVWDLTGRVTATTGRPMQAYLDPVWEGDRVLLSGRTGEDAAPIWRLWTWQPGTGAVRMTNRGGMTDWTGSADGALLAGSVAQEGTSTDQANPCVLVRTAPRGSEGDEWQSCDWRLNGPRTAGAFSPDGRRLLTIATDSDGFGPGSFAVVSATDGPSTGVTQVDAPDWTLDAQWLDDDHLVLRSRTSDAEDAGTVLTRCDLRGACTQVARLPRGDVVVGEQY